MGQWGMGRSGSGYHCQTISSPFVTILFQKPQDFIPETLATPVVKASGIAHIHYHLEPLLDEGGRGEPAEEARDVILIDVISAKHNPNHLNM